MSCYAMRVQEMAANIIRTDTGYGKPKNEAQIAKNQAFTDEISRLAKEASDRLINLVEGFSPAIEGALRADSGMKTNDPNSHELEESVVDGFLLAVQGAAEVWGWETRGATLKAKIVEELLRPKGEDDFPGSVFGEADRDRLLPFLEGVTVGGRNVFEALQGWYDDVARSQPAAAHQAGTGSVPADVAWGTGQPAGAGEIGKKG